MGYMINLASSDEDWAYFYDVQFQNSMKHGLLPKDLSDVEARQAHMEDDFCSQGAPKTSMAVFIWQWSRGRNSIAS